MHLRATRGTTLISLGLHAYQSCNLRDTSQQEYWQIRLVLDSREIEHGRNNESDHLSACFHEKIRAVIMTHIAGVAKAPTRPRTTACRFLNIGPTPVRSFVVTGHVPLMCLWLWLQLSETDVDPCELAHLVSNL